MERTGRRLAAARRAVQRDKDATPLFPEMARHQTAAERLDALDNGRNRDCRIERARLAAKWREARRQLAALRPLTRAGILRYWNGTGIVPREPHYLLDEIYQVTRFHADPWRQVRILRQFKLLGQGRLPKSVFAAIRAWDRPRAFQTWQESARIHRRLHPDHKTHDQLQLTQRRATP